MSIVQYDELMRDQTLKSRAITLGLPRYQHKPLPGSHWLRILSIVPGAPDSTLRCRLEAHENPKKIRNHNLSSGTSDGYEALSWCWGQAGDEQDLIVLQDETAYTFPVRKALYAALFALRKQSSSRHLWVDFVCIDQSNLSERNQQVARMHEIFADAFNVCIWLGLPDEDSVLALSFVQEHLSKAYLMDEFLGEEQHLPKWAALIALMRRHWFQRRWIVQEVALASSATVHCGYDTIDWELLSSIILSMIKPDGILSRLSSLARQGTSLGFPEEYLDEISNLGAARLVSISTRFFRREAGNALTPTSRLEDIVASMAFFENSEPRDTIYALLALASDTQRTVIDQIPDYLHGKRLDDRQKRILLNVLDRLPDSRKQSYPVRYDLDVVDVYQQFIKFVVKQADRTRALDILCRPFAQDYYQGYQQHDLFRSSRKGVLPSWIPHVNNMPFAKHAPFIDDSSTQQSQTYTMKRRRGDLFVSTPDSSHYYSADGQIGCDASKIYFRKRPGHFSMFVDGFILDKVDKITDRSEDGNIPITWLDLGREHEDGDAFWRTLIADRGSKGSTPAAYKRILKEVLKQHREFSFNTQKLLSTIQSSQVSELLRHLVATISGRVLIETSKFKFLGLAPGNVQCGDLVCIIRGCSVPLILRQGEEKDHRLDAESDRTNYFNERKAAYEKIKTRFSSRRAERKVEAEVQTSLEVPKVDAYSDESSWSAINLDGIELPCSYGEMLLAIRLASLFTVTTFVWRAHDALGFLVLTIILGTVMILRSKGVRTRIKAMFASIFVMYLSSFPWVLTHFGLLTDAMRLAAIIFVVVPELLLQESVMRTILQAVYHRLRSQIKTRSSEVLSTVPKPARDEQVWSKAATRSIAAKLTYEPSDPRSIVQKYAFTLIGESYIDTMMTGEAIKLQNESVLSKDRMHTVTFELR